jgi:ketosteroid isomerase-like protein
VSSENVDIVRRAYEAIARGDWDAAFSFTHPDFSMTTKRGPRAGTHRGREEVQDFGEDYIGAFDDFAMEPEEFHESGDHVVAVVKRRARPEGGSIDIEVRNGHLFTLREGQILSLESFPDPKDALAAIGLEP